MRRLLIILLACVQLAGCERYHRIQEDLVEDRSTGKLYFVQGNEMHEVQEVKPPRPWTPSDISDLDLSTKEGILEAVRRNAKANPGR